MKITIRNLILLTLFGTSFVTIAQNNSNAKKAEVSTVVVPANPMEVRYKLLDDTFRDFVKTLHGENKMQAKTFLSESVKDMVGPEALEALSKSIRRDNPILTLSKEILYDVNANNMEYLVYGYTVDTEPKETIQIKFDNLGKIISIQSSHPNKK